MIDATTTCGNCDSALDAGGERWPSSGNVVCFACLEPFEEDLRREMYDGALEPEESA